MSGDPYFGSVVSLLHFEGAEGQTTISDEKGLTWNRYGSGTYITTENYKFGSSCLKNTQVDSDFNTAPGLLDVNDKFTIEGWFFLLGPGFHGSSAGAHNAIIMQDADASSGEQGVFVSATSGAVAYTLKAGNSSRPSIVGATTIAFSTWYHLALTWDGTTHRLFINGNLDASLTYGNGWRNTGHPIRLGRSLVPSYSNYRFALNGYLDEFRITRGVARYTSNFTPPNAPFPNQGPPSDSRIITDAPLVNRIPATLKGNHRVYGTVRLENDPAPNRRVLLYDPKSMRPVAQTFTDANGYYEFVGLKPGVYLVVGQDRLTRYHPDIVRVQSVPM